MKKINREIESYLFDGENGKFRAIPFYELSIDEFVIYQNQEPKYLIDFNYRESSFVKQIKKAMEQGVDLEEIINGYGIYLGLDWTTKHNIVSNEIPNSQQTEKVELERIESFGDVASELIFIATDNYNKSDFINENELLDIYDFFEKKIKFLRSIGIKHSKIIIDPGIGFGKNLKHNMNLISNISIFHSLGFPILVGNSRKRFIKEISGKNDTKSRIGGTVASSIYLMSQGIQILRIHDVNELLQGIKVFKKLFKN